MVALFSIEISCLLQFLESVFLFLQNLISLNAHPSKYAFLRMNHEKASTRSRCLISNFTDTLDNNLPGVINRISMESALDDAKESFALFAHFEDEKMH